MDVHTESEQYAVIIGEQFRRRYRMDYFVVLFRRIANKVTVVTPTWQMYSNCLSRSWTV